MARVFIIAEAGVNHNGNIVIAKKLIDEAKNAGVDAVKFQTYKAKKLVSKYAPKADYQKQTTNVDESQMMMLKKLELTYEDHMELIKYCVDKNIMFLSTAFDFESLEFLEKLGIPIHKVPSGDINNLPYLIKVAQTKKTIIISSGMSMMSEVKEALQVLKQNGASDVTILHCNTEYPTPYEDVNLQAMVTIGQELSVPVGYSDHTLGIEIPIAAVALGAVIIEKHFTLDRNMEGPDHKASLEPLELKAMVTAIRNVEMAKGIGIKHPSSSEQKNIIIARKSIVAACEVKKGEVFKEDNITVKRPGNGISPMLWYDVLGSIAKRDFQEDEMIEL